MITETVTKFLPLLKRTGLLTPNPPGIFREKRVPNYWTFNVKALII